MEPRFQFTHHEKIWQRSLRDSAKSLQFRHVLYIRGFFVKAFAVNLFVKKCVCGVCETATSDWECDLSSYFESIENWVEMFS